MELKKMNTWNNITTIERRSALALLTSICLAAGAVFAHGGMEHVQGKVAKVSDASITVTTTAGKTAEVGVDAKTTYSKAAKGMQKSDLKVGDRVVIHAEEVNEKLIARTVEIGPAAPAKAPVKVSAKPAAKAAPAAPVTK
jgi:hypothetical protein